MAGIIWIEVLVLPLAVAIDTGMVIVLAMGAADGAAGVGGVDGPGGVGCPMVDAIGAACVALVMVAVGTFPLGFGVCVT